MRKFIMWNARLKRQPGNDLFIFGSGLNPLILGGGNPLFKPGPERVRMRLLEARPLESGCVILRYEPQR